MALAFTRVLSGTFLGVHGAIVLRVAHGLASSGLFVLANSNYQATNSRRLLLSKGIIAFSPQITLFWCLVALMNMGTPPLLSFLSEMVLVSVLTQMMPYFLFPVCMGIVLTVAYTLHLVIRTQHGWPPLYLSPHCVFTHRVAIRLVAHLVPAGVGVLGGDVLFSIT